MTVFWDMIMFWGTLQWIAHSDSIGKLDQELKQI